MRYLRFQTTSARNLAAGDLERGDQSGADVDLRTQHGGGGGGKRARLYSDTIHVTAAHAVRYRDCDIQQETVHL